MYCISTKEDSRFILFRTYTISQLKRCSGSVVVIFVYANLVINSYRSIPDKQEDTYYHFICRSGSPQNNMKKEKEDNKL